MTATNSNDTSTHPSMDTNAVSNPKNPQTTTLGIRQYATTTSYTTVYNRNKNQPAMQAPLINTEHSTGRILTDTTVTYLFTVTVFVVKI